MVMGFGFVGRRKGGQMHEGIREGLHEWSRHQKAIISGLFGSRKALSRAIEKASGPLVIALNPCRMPGNE